MQTRGGATSPAAELARAIYALTLDEVQGDRLTQGHVSVEGAALRLGPRRYALDGIGAIRAVAIGKAAVGMARAAGDALGERLGLGLAVTKLGAGVAVPGFTVLEAAHPTPDATSLAAGMAVAEAVAGSRPGDLTICLLSGGASALAELPAEGVSLEDLAHVTTALLRAGTAIGDLNAVRGCLSSLKCGGLTRLAAPAQVVCLVLSDVLGNPLDVIGSGLCFGAGARPDAARDVLRRHGVWDGCPASVRARLERAPTGSAGATEVRHVIVGDIDTALTAAADAARGLGLRPLIVTNRLQGDAEEAGRRLGALALDLLDPVSHGGYDCLILGGETTATVRGAGLGGRCQVAAAPAAAALRSTEGLAVLAAGTDGTDGPTDAAGGLVDGQTALRAEERGLDLEQYLTESDSYHWLQGAGGLIRTGPTHSNVNDLHLVVAASRR
jgi:glycerate-2-kinase